MKESKLKALRAAVLEDAESDIVSLTSIIHLAETFEPKSSSDSATKDEVLFLIGKLIEEDGMRFGRWSNSAYLEVWPGTSTEIVRRISLEWATLGREPTLGEIGYIGDPERFPEH